MQELEEVYAPNESWENQFTLLENLSLLNKVRLNEVIFDNKDLKEFWRDSLLTKDQRTGEVVRVDSGSFFLHTSDVRNRIVWKIRRGKQVENDRARVLNEFVRPEYKEDLLEPEAPVDSVDTVAQWVKESSKIIRRIIFNFKIDMTKEVYDLKLKEVESKLDDFRNSSSEEEKAELLDQLKAILLYPSLYDQQQALMELWNTSNVLGDYPFDKIDFNKHTAGYEEIEPSTPSIWDKVMAAIRSVVIWAKSLIRPSSLNKPTYDNSKLPEIRHESHTAVSEAFSKSKATPAQRDDITIEVGAEVTEDRTFGAK